MKSNSDKKLSGRKAVLTSKLLLSLVLLGTIASVIGFQWNTTHVFNPLWHPHARFHAVQLSGFIIIMSLIGLWLVWRHSAEPHIGTRVAAAVPVIFWSGEFYALLVPGTSPAYDLNNPNTFELLPGIAVYGNLFLSGILIVLSLLGCWLSARSKLVEKE